MQVYDNIFKMLKRKYFRRPHRIKKKRSVFKSWLFGFGVLILIIGAGIFYTIIFSAWFQITEIEIKGNKEISSQEIKEIIQPLIKHQVVFWNTKSIFLTNFKEINNFLLKRFPGIAGVEIKKIFPKTLIVIINERKPVAIFYHQDQKFFIDKEGVIFKKAEKGQEINFLKIENLIFEKELILDRQVLEKKLMEQIIKIKQQLNKKEILITGAVLASKERLNIKTVENWEIYFSLRDDISTQIFNLGVVMRERISPERRKNLKYIDLRFDKIFIYPSVSER
jgi:cell division septal protein FtsQ